MLLVLAAVAGVVFVAPDQPAAHLASGHGTGFSSAHRHDDHGTADRVAPTSGAELLDPSADGTGPSSTVRVSPVPEGPDQHPHGAHADEAAGRDGPPQQVDHARAAAVAAPSAAVPARGRECAARPD